MTTDAPGVLAALARATATLKRNQEPRLVAAILAALQQELTDLGFAPPLHPELALQLHRLTSMVADAVPGRVDTPGPPTDDADQADDGSEGAGPFTRLSQLMHAMAHCTTLTLCDEWLLQGLGGISSRAFLADLLAALPPQLTQLEIFVKPGKRDAVIAAGLHDHCTQRGIPLIHRLTKELHDRVWIFDNRHAFVIGASFGGLTDRCAFIVELPREPRDRFIGKLRPLRERSRWAPGMSMDEA
ncbi:MAG: hypothetical protein WBW32_03140 [Luteibacter sp.]